MIYCKKNRLSLMLPLLTIFLGFFTVQNAKAESSLTNQEIDIIFIGFEREEEIRRIEKLKKEKEKEKEKKKQKEEEKKSSSREILPSGANMIVKNNKFESSRAGLFSQPPFPNSGVSNGFLFSQNQKKVKIQGIVCKKTKCLASTNIGILEVGSAISVNESVIKIDSRTVTTNIRKLKL